MMPDLHDKLQNHIILCCLPMEPEGRAAAWILWLRDEYGTFEKVSYGGRVLRNASAMTAEREALRMGIEHLTVLFPTEVSSFDFETENSGRTVQYKLNAQSLRLFGLHRDVNDAHRAGANRLQNKKSSVWIVTCSCERSRKFPRSRAREEDRKSSSSKSTSSRFAAE